MGRRFLSLAAIAFAALLVAQSGRTTLVPDVENGPTIVIMPAGTDIAPPDDLALAALREPLRTCARAVLPRITGTLRTADESAAAAATRGRLSRDPAYRLLLDQYDQAVSRYRGERGAAVKRAHAEFLARTRAALAAHGIGVASTDPVSGFIFVDDDFQDIETVGAAVPWARVEQSWPPVSFDPDMNAETRVSWLQNRGIVGSNLDYFLLDGPLDTTVTDIVDGHTLYANADTLIYPPFIPNHHGTAVCSIVASRNGVATGGAFGLDDIFVSTNGSSIWFGPYYPSYVRSLSWGCADTDSLFGDSPDVVSLQFGSTGGNYNAWARFGDSAIDEFAILMATAAGNVAYSSRYSLADIAHIYNALAVNALDASGDTLRANDVTCSSSYFVVGSWGPAADGRKKPDLSVPVVGMQYQQASGTIQTCQDGSTSWAAPQVAAADLLLMEGTGLTDPRSIKALLINTAYKPDAADSVGWEPGYGWGMLDADHAEMHGENGDCFEDTLTAQGGKGSKKFFVGDFLPVETANNHRDRATLVWNRHLNWSYADTGIAAKNLANLDLYLYDRLTGAQVAGSRSTIDNVEQVAWTDEADTLRSLVVVDVQSNLPLGYSYEYFSLATEEGFTQVSDPVGLNVELATPVSAYVDQPYEIQYRVFLAGVAACDTVWPQLTGLDRYSAILSGPTPPYANLAQGDTVIISYTLLSTTWGQRSVTFGASAECYRRPWCDSALTVLSVAPEIQEQGSNARATEFALVGMETTDDGVRLLLSVPDAEDLEIRVYDIRGREVYRARDIVNAGVHSIEWQYCDSAGRGVPTGMYLIAVKRENLTITRKITRVR